MSEKPLEVDEIISVLNALEDNKWRNVRFCLFSDGTGRIDQGAGSKSIESWSTISELTERMRVMGHESKRDRIAREAIAYCKGLAGIRPLNEAVVAFLESEPKNKESNDESTRRTETDTEGPQNDHHAADA